MSGGAGPWGTAPKNLKLAEALAEVSGCEAGWEVLAPAPPVSACARRGIRLRGRLGGARSCPARRRVRSQKHSSARQAGRCSLLPRPPARALAEAFVCEAGWEVLAPAPPVGA